MLTLKWAGHIFGCCYYTFIMQFSQTGKSWLPSCPYFVKWPITSMTVFSAWICPPVVRVGIGPAVANLHMHKYMSHEATTFSLHYAVAIVIINQILLWLEGRNQLYLEQWAHRFKGQQRFWLLSFSSGSWYHLSSLYPSQHQTFPARV